MKRRYGSDPIIKKCGCGNTFTQAQWKKLEHKGYLHTPADEVGPEELLELRNCPCHSTLAVEVPVDTPR